MMSEKPAISLLFRREKLFHFNPITCDYNSHLHHLILGNASTIQVWENQFNNFNLLQSFLAEENITFQKVLYVSDAKVYLVIYAKGGNLHSRVICSSLEEKPKEISLLCSDCTLLSCLYNNKMNELITSDSAGGIKLWAFRVRKKDSNYFYKLPLKFHVHNSKKTLYSCIRLDEMGKFLFSSSGTSIRIFDVSSGKKLYTVCNNLCEKVVDMAFSTSVNCLFVQCARENTIHVWNLCFHPTVSGGKVYELKCSNDKYIRLCCLRLGEVNGCTDLIAMDFTGNILFFECSARGYQSRAETYKVPISTSGDLEALFLFPIVGWCGRDFILTVAEGSIGITEIYSEFSVSRLYSSMDRIFYFECSYQSQKIFVVDEDENQPRAKLMALSADISCELDLFHSKNLIIEELKNAHNKSWSLSKEVHKTNAIKPIAFCYSSLMCCCLVGWCDKRIDIFDTGSGKYLRSIKNSTQDRSIWSIETVKTSMGIIILAVDIDGFMNSWIFDSNSYTYLGITKVHKSRLLIISDLACHGGMNLNENLVISASESGEVSLWKFTSKIETKNSPNQFSPWNMIGYFTTGEGKMTSMAIIQSEFISCGFRSGQFEIWKIPYTESKNIIARTKTPIISIAHHKSEINHIFEFGATNYSIICTCSIDLSVVVWYQTEDIALPIRQLKLHKAILGGCFMKTTDEVLKLVLCGINEINIIEYISLDDKKSYYYELYQKEFEMPIASKYQQSDPSTTASFMKVWSTGSSVNDYNCINSSQERSIDYPTQTIKDISNSLSNHRHSPIPNINGLKVHVVLPHCDTSSALAVNQLLHDNENAVKRKRNNEEKTSKYVNLPLNSPTELLTVEDNSIITLELKNERPLMTSDELLLSQEERARPNKAKSYIRVTTSGEINDTTAKTPHKFHQQVNTQAKPCANSIPSSFQHSVPRIYKTKIETQKKNVCRGIVSLTDLRNANFTQSDSQNKLHIGLISMDDTLKSRTQKYQSRLDKDFAPCFQKSRIVDHAFNVDRSIVTGSGGVGCSATPIRVDDCLLSTAVINDEKVNKYYKSEPSRQEKISIVSLSKIPYGSKKGMLFLDNNVPQDKNTSPTFVEMDSSSSVDKALTVYNELLRNRWTSLTEEQQQMEVKASLKCLSVQAAAQLNRITIPKLDSNLQDPSSKKILAKYTHWFSTDEKVRNQFLQEELLFASQDKETRKQARLSGAEEPVEGDNLVRNPNKRGFSRWTNFVVWYNKGVIVGDIAEIIEKILASGGDILESSVSPMRAYQRNQFLEKRLELISQAEEGFARLQRLEINRQTAARNAAQKMMSMASIKSRIGSSQKVPIVLPKELQSLNVDIFKNIDLFSGDQSEILAWKTMTYAEKEKELAIALHDDDVRLAAMKENILLPDEISEAMICGLDDMEGNIETKIQTCVEKFLSWWTRPNNIIRQQFLKNEADQAAKDSKVKTAARKIGIEVAYSTAVDAFSTSTTKFNADCTKLDEYHEWYFMGKVARLNFLKRRVLDMQKKKRLHSIIEWASIAKPILFEVLPGIGESMNFLQKKIKYFSFDEKRYTPEEVSMWYTDEELLEDDMTMIKFEVDESMRRKKYMERKEFELQRLMEDQKQMEIEDELSKNLNLMDNDVESDGEDEEANVKPRDFSKSYFFNDLQSDPRSIISSRWVNGIGLYNNDEQFDERERAEDERKRQVELDRIAAEKLAEEERLAEEKRMQKELEEYNLWLKKQHQKDVKRILDWEDRQRKKRQFAKEEKSRLEEVACMAREEMEEKDRLQKIHLELEEMISEDSRSRQYENEIKIQTKREISHRRECIKLMTIEDIYSREYAMNLRKKMQRAADRTKFLTDIYTSFTPYFPPSDEHANVRISSPLKLHQKRFNNNYTIPHAQAILETPQTEIYAVSTSNKFKSLMGLPVDYKSGVKSKKKRVQDSLNTLHRSQSVPGNLTPANTDEISQIYSHPSTFWPNESYSRLPSTANAASTTSIRLPRLSTPNCRPSTTPHEIVSIEEPIPLTVVKNDFQPSRCNAESAHPDETINLESFGYTEFTVNHFPPENNYVQMTQHSNIEIQKKASRKQSEIESSKADYINSNEYKNDFRQIKLPPPFFKGNLGIKGKKGEIHKRKLLPKPNNQIEK